MRLPRMTTRRWMVAVLTVSLLLGAFVMLRRAAQFMRLAAVHENLADHLRGTAGPAGDLRAAEHNERLARMYQRAGGPAVVGGRAGFGVKRRGTSEPQRLVGCEREGREPCDCPE